MIIYGYREASLQAGTFEGAVCPHCGQQGHVAGAVFSRHAHIMFIPLFPIYKRMEIWCQDCGGQSQVGNYPTEIQTQMREFKRRQKPKIWQFLGLILIVVFIGSAIISGQREKANTGKYVENPALNDVYCLRYDDNKYSLVMIAGMEGDSIFFYNNEYHTSKMSNVKKLHRPDFYEQGIVYGYSRDEVRELYEDKTIRYVWRDLPYNTEKIKVKEADAEEKVDEDAETENEEIVEE